MSTELPPASERPLPSGDATLAPFRDAHEHVAALFGLTAIQIAAAIAERTGEADPIELRLETLRRAVVLDARLAIALDRGIALPLATAFDAWELDGDDRMVLACLLGAELVPGIAAGLARLGGTTVEAVAAVLRPDGVTAVLERLAHGATLAQLGLVSVAGDGPLIHRDLVVAPRLVPLALGSLAVDTALGAELRKKRTPSLPVDHVDAAGYARLRALIARETALPVGVLVTGRGGGAVPIAVDAALSLARPALILRTIPNDRGWCDAVAREALLHRAAVIIDADGLGAPAQLVRRLAQLAIPVVIACDAVEPSLEGLPQLRIELPPLDVAQREVLWRAALGGSGAEVDARSLAVGARVGAAAIAHAVGHARLLAETTGRSYLTRADLADGVAAALSVGPWSRRGGHLEPILPVAIAERVRGIAARADDGIVAVVTGSPGSGKTTIARALAAELGIDHVELDVAGATPRALEAALVAADAGLVVLALVNAPGTLAARLRASRGIVLLPAEREDEIDPVLRRIARQHVALRPFAREDRERLWAAALPELADHAEVARDLELNGGQIVAIARSLGPQPSIEAIRAAARRLSS